MKKHRILLAIAALGTICMGGLLAPPNALTIEDVQRTCAELQTRVTQLETRTTQLEAMLKDSPKAVAPSGRQVMKVTSLELPQPDPAVQAQINVLRDKMEQEEAKALKADKEAEEFISKNKKSIHDATYDAKRKEILSRADGHRKKAREHKGEALRLQRQVEERGPEIRGWNGSRTVVLEMTKALPASVDDVLPGDFISWIGKVRMSDETMEIWTALTVSPIARPDDFRD